MSTVIHLEFLNGPGHVVTFRQPLTPDQQRRVLQATANFVRTLQLWLEAEKEEVLPPVSSGKT